MVTIGKNKFAYREKILKNTNDTIQFSFLFTGPYIIKGEMDIDNKNFLVKKIDINDFHYKYYYITYKDGDDFLFSIRNFNGDTIRELLLEAGAPHLMIFPDIIFQWQHIIMQQFKNPKTKKFVFTASVPLYKDSAPLWGSFFINEKPEYTSFVKVKVKIVKKDNDKGYLFKIYPFKIEILTNKNLNILEYHRENLTFIKK